MPLLRVPAIVDPVEAAGSDAHLAELTEWATTVVKLPLQREGHRIRQELLDFDAQSLVLLKSVSELTIVLGGRRGYPHAALIIAAMPRARAAPSRS